MRFLLHFFYVPYLFTIRLIVNLIFFYDQIQFFDIGHELLFSIKVGTFAFCILLVISMVVKEKKSFSLKTYYLMRGLITIIIFTTIIVIVALIIPNVEKNSVLYWIGVLVSGEFFRNLIMYYCDGKRSNER